MRVATFLRQIYTSLLQVKLELVKQHHIGLQLS